MSNEHVAGIHIVRVTMADAPGEPVQLWVAAVPRDQAAAAVQKAIPARWKAELTDQLVTKELAARVKLRPGDVAELSSAHD